MANKNVGKINNGAIIFAIFSNLLWGAAFCIATIVALPSPLTTVSQILKGLPLPVFIGVPIFMLIYPLLGKGSCELVYFICNKIDTVYELAEPNLWGEWTKGTKLVFASWWPLAAPIGLAITLIAMLYGLLFNKLYK